MIRSGRICTPVQIALGQLENSWQTLPRFAISVPMIFALALALSCITPRSEAATVVFTDTWKSVYVQGTGYSVSDDGCVETYLYFHAFDTPEGPSAAYSRTTYNNCTTEVQSLNGGSNTLQFEHDASLTNGHVIATIPLVEWQNGQQVGDVRVDSTWRAKGNKLVSRSTSTYHEIGNYRYSISSWSKVKEASVTGTLDLQQALIGEADQASFNLQHGA